MTEIKDYRSAGGKARAEKLTPEQRKAIAQKAAESRWAPPQAEYEGEIRIGDITIICAVLPGGTRVLSERAITKAFGGKRGGSHWRRKKQNEDGADLPVFMSANNIMPFINNDLSLALSNPIKYRQLNSGVVAHGFEASKLPEICNTLLSVRDAGKAHPSQLHIIQQAEVIIRALAHVGIIGLVDEATGYQEVRDRHALQAILDKYLRKEFAAWAKRFPDEFYKQMFRLKGWVYPTEANSKPGIVGTYTNNIVYERLAPGLLEELETLNPKMDSGSRKSKHHQWLTTDVGHPALAQHLHAIIGFMRVSQSWDQFINMIDIAFPRKGHTIPLAFE